MAATLRSGLSFGLCGFSFWSHDIGGFVHPAPKELYRRWTPFGLLTSHSRCHGVPPREPWVYGKAFEDEFRLSVELKYRLMPYIYAQAAECSKQGFPMLRTLFFEFPDDITSWLIEDEYLFGSKSSGGAAHGGNQGKGCVPAAGNVVRLSERPELPGRTLVQDKTFPHSLCDPRSKRISPAAFVSGPIHGLHGLGHVGLENFQLDRPRLGAFMPARKRGLEESGL